MEGVTGLFIDWIQKTPMYEGAWMNQASLLQRYIKSGIPIVIYDRAFSLTEKEVEWVMAFNSFIKKEAKKYGFPVVDVGDRKDYIQKIKKISGF